MADTVIQLKQLTGELDKQSRILKDIKKAWTDIEKLTGQVSADVSGSGGGNLMANSLGKFTTGEKWAMGLSAVGGMFQMGASALPTTSDVTQYATNYYNAGVMQGFGGKFTQGQMYNALSAGLGKFGIQSPMAVGQLAMYYGQRGVTVGNNTGFNAGYESSLTAAVGGAARYLNMDTNRAAAALENLTAGAGGQSANLLRQLGIFTADPYTGKVKSQSQLFQEIHNRITAGMPTLHSAAQVQEQYRRGALGYFLKNSGMSEDQQQMFYVSEMYRAETGKNLDLGNKGQVSAAMSMLEKKGFVNPQQQLNAIAGSEAGVLQSAQGSYIQGLKDAVPIIEGLNNAAGKLAATFGRFKAALEAINSTNAGRATTGALGSIGSGGLTILGTMGGKNPVTPGAKPGIGSRLASGLKSPTSWGGAAAATVVSGVSAGINIANGGPIGANVGNAIGTGLGTWLGGAAGSLLDGVLGPMGTIGGMMLGGWLGGMAGSAIGGLFDNAQGGPNAGGGNTTHATKGAPKFVRPASGNITSGYGPRTPPTPGASSFHKGVDIANASGTPIVAAASGKVVAAGGNNGYGNQVKVDHGGGYVTTYSHMSRIDVRVHDQVSAGTKLGGMGMTGIATGVHLHFEVFRDGANIDPATIVPGLKSGGGVATVTNSLKASKGKAGGKNRSASTAATVSNGGGITNGSSLLASLLNLESPLNGYSSGATTAAALVNIAGKTAVSLPISTGATSTGTTPSSTTYTGMGGPSNHGAVTSSVRQGDKTPVVIHLNIQKASESEARRFASLVKDILENDSNISKIGSA